GLDALMLGPLGLQSGHLEAECLDTPGVAFLGLASELFEAGTFFREPDPLRLETTSLLGEGVVPGEDRIRFGCRRGLLDDGPLLFDRCGGRRRPGLDPGLGHEVGLHRLTQFPDARRLDAIAGLPDGHPPWDGPYPLHGN